MTGLRVAVIAGGLSLEREVSLHSGRRVADALRHLGHDVVSLDVDDVLVDRLQEGGFDAAYLTVHGRVGEDGTVQGLLDLLGIPYTGPDAVSSGLAWDKSVMKGMWQRERLRTPAWLSLSVDAIRDLGARRVLPGVVERLGLPLIVKPTQGGASMGVGHVEEADQLTDALVASYRYHSVALIERVVVGTEVAVSVVADEALPPVEIAPLTERYDFSARYTPGAIDLHAPARLSKGTNARCQEVAVAAMTVAGCSNVTRADMIVDADGQPWLLELDTCPGMTETSLLPAAADAAGWSFDELCDRVLSAALGR